MSKSLFKSTIVVMGMTLISRIFGFIRDMVTANYFGASAAFDAFSVAFKIPNFMRRLFAEGSFSQAFVPVLSEYKSQQGVANLRAFIDAMCGTLGVVLVGVTCLGVIFAPAIVHVFAPGFVTQGARFDLAVTLLRITFPYLLFISLTAFAGAILNTHAHYGIAALTPVLLNICMIATTIWLSSAFKVPIVALAWGVFVAGIVQLLFQLPFLKAMQLLPRPRVDWRHAGVRRVLKLMVPALFGVSVSQVNLLVDTLFASLLMVGSISWLYYADRLMTFPLGVFGVAISTVILPHLSRHHAEASQELFSLTLDWALRVVLLVGVPASLMLAILSGPMLTTLFQHGHFTAFDVMMSRKSVMAFAIGIIPFMLIKILAAGFYARQTMQAPVRIGVIAMIANIILNIIFIWPLAHAGIALATSLAAILNMGWLFYLLRQNNLYQPRTGWTVFATRLFIANTVLAGWLWIASDTLPVWLTHHLLWRIEHLTMLLGLAAVFYFATLWLTGVRLTHVLIPARAGVK